MGEVPEPEVVVDENENCEKATSERVRVRTGMVMLTAGCNEERVCEFDVGEPAHIAKVYDVGDDA